MCSQENRGSGPSLKRWTGKSNWPLGAGCETLRLEGYCREREREQPLGSEAGVRIGCTLALGKDLYEFYE